VLAVLAGPAQLTIWIDNAHIRLSAAREY
jgi:hypothetical protein